MKLNCLILNARYVSYIKDDRKVEGVSFQYIDNIEPVETEQGKGYPVSSGWMKKEEWKNVSIVPAFYDIDFDLRTDSRGNRTLSPLSVTFTSEV